MRPMLRSTGAGVLGAGAIDDRLRSLHIDMLDWCVLNKYRKPVGKPFSCENLSRDKTRSYPELSSSYKAASVKLVAIYLCTRACDLPPESDHNKLVITCAWSYLEYLRILDESGRYMTQHERAGAYDAAGLFLQTYAKLAKQSWYAGVFMWKVRPKHHHMDHVRTLLKSRPLGPCKPPCIHQVLMF